jgi:hypothetical protein
MLRTPARQAILAASRSTRSSIIARSLSTAPKRASVSYVPLSVFVLTIDPELSYSQLLCLDLDSILPLSYVVCLTENGVGDGWSIAETVKVPQMAESITEGTLKQWNKAVGDFVNQDEEIATIETDKVGPF